MFICYTDWLSDSRGPWCETENPSLCCVCVCAPFKHKSTYTFYLSVTKKRSAHVVFHIKCSCATHCFPDLTQQEATAYAVTPLPTPSLSITHTLERSHWQSSSLSPSLALLLPTVETRSDYPPLFPRQTHQQIYCQPSSPLCRSLWKRLNAVLNCTFFSIPLHIVKIPPRPELTCWAVSERWQSYLISLNLTGCEAVNNAGEESTSTCGFWRVQGCTVWPGGQYWCMMCKAFNVNRGWRGKGNVPIQISITLSSSPCCLVAMTSWRTRTKTGGNDWFLMSKQCLPEACGSHISKQAVGLWVVPGFGGTYHIRKWHSVCWIYNEFRMSLSYFSLITFRLYLFMFLVIWQGQRSLINTENTANEPELV